MALKCNGTIVVQDNNGRRHTINGIDLDLDEVEQEERSGGTETTYKAETEVSGVSVTVTVNAYPDGAYNDHSVEIDNGQLVADNLKFESDEE